MSEHSIYDEMRRVHDQMDAKYKMRRSAATDIRKAQKMEMYLRAFKAAGNKNNDKIHPVIKGLDAQAMSDIADQVGAALGIGKYSLFRMQHKWYLDSQSRWGADDVFEAELQQFLNIAVEQATQGQATGDAQILGSLPGNIAKGFLREISKNGQKMVQGKQANFVNTPTFRSGKVDVASFNGNFSFDADMSPFWKDFLNTFKGARFTVKNYGSSKYEAIHLGNTDITKSLLGSLSDIGNTQKQATHIFYHSLAHAGEAGVSEHLLHLRFAYELAGGGLQDAAGNKIDSADFFIYNDPTSNNIYVRSTKEMIANAMDYMGAVQDPLHSHIIILKNSFN